MFDAPGSESSRLTVAAGYGLLLGPLTLVFSFITGLALASIKPSSWQTRIGPVIALLPMVHLAWVIVAFVLIEVVCAGYFVCR